MRLYLALSVNTLGKLERHWLQQALWGCSLQQTDNENGQVQRLLRPQV